MLHAETEHLGARCPQPAAGVSAAWTRAAGVVSPGDGWWLRPLLWVGRGSVASE